MKTETKKETRKYEKLEDGRLFITIDEEGPLALPPPQGQTKGLVIGTQKQITKQHVDKEKIEVLKNFINNQKNATEGQLTNMKADLKKIEYTDDKIPDKIVEALSKSLTKGSKAFKKQTINLQKYVADLQRKKTLIQSIEFLQKQSDAINKELTEITKALK